MGGVGVGVWGGRHPPPDNGFATGHLKGNLLIDPAATFFQKRHFFFFFPFFFFFLQQDRRREGSPVPLQEAAKLKYRVIKLDSDSSNKLTGA